VHSILNPQVTSNSDVSQHISSKLLGFTVDTGDASGRFWRGKDVFAGQIPGRPLPIRQFHLHSGHRLPGEGTATSAVAVTEFIIPTTTVVDYQLHSHMIVSLSTLQSLPLIVDMLMTRLLLLHCYLIYEFTQTYFP
jgi:hypothetical protein